MNNSDMENGATGSEMEVITDVLHDPRTQHWDWVADYERASQSRVLHKAVRKRPPAPLSSTLKVLKECLKRPEVVHSYSGKGPFPLGNTACVDPKAIYMWHLSYLKHKHRSTVDPVLPIAIPLEKIAKGEFIGVDDPRVIDFLLTKNVFDDRETAGV